jgi:hypothetical protein
MTPKEIAPLIGKVGSTFEDESNIRDFLFTAPARDIQMVMHLSYVTTDKPQFYLITTALQVRIADDQAKAMKQLEHHTMALVELTKAMLGEAKALRRLNIGLLILTAALLVFTIFLVVAEQRPHP